MTGDVCGSEHPLVRGLLCERGRGHRDAHERRHQLADGREIRTEWTVVRKTERFTRLEKA